MFHVCDLEMPTQIRHGNAVCHITDSWKTSHASKARVKMLWNSSPGSVGVLDREQALTSKGVWPIRHRRYAVVLITLTHFSTHIQTRQKLRPIIHFQALN